MKAGEYGLTLGTCFFARRLELVAVVGLMWVSRCVFGGANFFSVLSTSLHFQIHSWTQSQRGQRGLGEEDPIASQSAHRELAPTYSHQVYRLVCSHLRNLASAVALQ